MAFDAQAQVWQQDSQAEATKDTDEVPYFNPTGPDAATLKRAEMQGPAGHCDSQAGGRSARTRAVHFTAGRVNSRKRQEMEARPFITGRRYGCSSWGPGTSDDGAKRRGDAEMPAAKCRRAGAGELAGATRSVPRG